MFDTIAGISSALGIGAISIIRMSGNDAIKIINSVFSKKIDETVSHVINYGHIKEKDMIIDEVLISFMKAPKTFTREDVVEIYCHGGITTTNKILQMLLSNGARLSEPGEFTKRAYLNGRIDLIEAESIMDLINSKTESARKLAVNGINKNISNMIEELRKKISKILSNIEVNIDYPEYEDITIITKKMIDVEIKMIENRINQILKESKNGKIIKEGINTLILGKPNVGKSSILNSLLGEEKAIVTNIPGTTRDVVEGNFLLESIEFNILDTAGIRETDNLIEKIGVSKSLSLINDAELIILVINNNEEIEEEDLKLIELTKDKKRIIVINKIDLETKLKRDQAFDGAVEISAINNDLTKLKEKMKEMFNLEEISSKDPTYLFNNRQIGLLEKTLLSVKDVKKGLEDDLPVDIIEIDLKQIWDLLGEILGRKNNDELTDEIFKNFCLGK